MDNWVIVTHFRNFDSSQLHWTLGELVAMICDVDCSISPLVVHLFVPRVVRERQDVGVWRSPGLPKTRPRDHQVTHLSLPVTSSRAFVCC